jgi:hypothetical protein
MCSTTWRPTAPSPKRRMLCRVDAAILPAHARPERPLVTANRRPEPVATTCC